MNFISKFLFTVLIGTFYIQLNAESFDIQTQMSTDQLVELGQKLEASKKMLTELYENPMASRSPWKSCLIRLAKETGYVVVATIVGTTVIFTWYFESLPKLHRFVDINALAELATKVLPCVGIYALLKLIIERSSASQQELQDQIKEPLDLIEEALIAIGAQRVMLAQEPLA